MRPQSRWQRANSEKKRRDWDTRIVSSVLLDFVSKDIASTMPRSILRCRFLYGIRQAIEFNNTAPNNMKDLVGGTGIQGY